MVVGVRVDGSIPSGGGVDTGDGVVWRSPEWGWTGRARAVMLMSGFGLDPGFFEGIETKGSTVPSIESDF